VFFLLGPPRIEIDRRALAINRRKVFALASYLAVTGRTHDRDFLTELSFPDRHRDRAHASLRQTLSILRRLLGKDRVLVSGGSVTLCGPDLWIDMREFRRLASCGHEHSRQGRASEAAAALAAARRLYRGDLMAGFFLKDSPGFEDWQFHEQQNLRMELASILEALVAIDTDRGDLKKALERARAWLDLDPLEEHGSEQEHQLRNTIDDGCAHRVRAEIRRSMGGR
jgi:DNA-binding SARP family transcriptional activator